MAKDLLWTKLDGCPLADFPGGSDYKKRFLALEGFLNEKVHPAVTAGANAVDKGFLTDHGPEHIKTVIKRASDLLNTADQDVLSCYEAYILLAAIHVHDVGNLYGRDEHERLSEVVVQKLGPLFGTDAVEKRAILKIAEAHGGQNKRGKDKISELQREDIILNQPVRSRFLAALLRFADELADDRNRASRILIEEKIIPEESLIYHKYAYALHSVTVLKDAVNLKFDLEVADAVQPLKRDKKSVFLLDEIYSRTMKMHRERLYCMRFLRPIIDIDRIDVSIEVFNHRYSQELASIPYRLAEIGYPDETKPNIFALCPDLHAHAYGSPLNGSTLKFYIKDVLKRRKL